MCKKDDQVVQKTQIAEDPFEIVKGFRATQQKKRRKILRAINKNNKIINQRRHVFYSKFQQKFTEKKPSINSYYTQEQEFNMFFEQSANLVLGRHEVKDNFFASDFDLKEESEMFSQSTLVYEKHSLFVQQFPKFEFEGLC